MKRLTKCSGEAEGRDGREEGQPGPSLLLPGYGSTHLLIQTDFLGQRGNHHRLWVVTGLCSAPIHGRRCLAYMTPVHGMISGERAAHRPRPTPISGKCPEGIHSLGIPSKDAGWLNGLSTNSSWIKIVEKKKKKPQIVFSTIDLTVF